MRIGFGYDAHRYGDAMPRHHIMLGGVPVPYEREILAHSDGDVILHALCDAILGALALGDIGQHFPDSDPAFKGVDSIKLLRATWLKATGAGYSLGNADITLVAERPRVRAYVDDMRSRISEALGAGIDRVSVKATTTEKMGFIGREEGLAAQAVVLLEPGRS